MRTPLVALALAAVSLAFASTAWAQTLPEARPAPPAPPPPPPPPPPPAPPPPPPPAPAAHHGGLDLSTIEQLREQGILSQAEYELSGCATSRPLHGEFAHAREANTIVLGKWATTLYGFLEGDTIYDTTQSFTDAAGNAQVLRPSGQTAPFVSNLSGLPPGTVQPIQPSQGYLGSHGQMLMSVRNSRLGLRLKAPGTERVHTSALLEMDFLGNQPTVSQGSFFTSPTMRIRHAAFRVETPVVDVMVGQYWHLFGWMEGYLPATTEIQGVAGQLYARAPQIRISKGFKSDAVTFEIAVAAVRPPSLSEMPEGEAGLRLALNHFITMHTSGTTATALTPASIALSGDVRYFEVPEAASVLPTSMVNVKSGAGAADLFLPILPARDEHRGNALSLLAQAAYGAGISDLYAGMQSGVMFPFVPVTPALSGAPAWPTNMDQGLVSYDITGFALHPVQWTSVLAGLEYYLPGVDGRVWLSANVSRVQSNNTSTFARALSDTPNPNEYFFPASTAQVRKGETWWDANLFFEPVQSVRVGLEFAQFMDTYVDGYTAKNTRVQAPASSSSDRAAQERKTSMFGPKTHGRRLLQVVLRPRGPQRGGGEAPARDVRAHRPQGEARAGDRREGERRGRHHPRHDEAPARDVDHAARPVRHPRPHLQARRRARPHRGRERAARAPSRSAP